MESAIFSTVLFILVLLTATRQSAAQEPAGAVSSTPAERKVVITGKIEGYKQIYKTGELSLLDGVTRLSQEHVFDISSDGNFTIEFDLLHATQECVKLDLEGDYNWLFLEPGTNYTVSIEAGQLKFVGESGRSSNDVARHHVAQARDLAVERAKAHSIHWGDLSVAVASAGYEDYAQKRRAHLAAYAE